MAELRLISIESVLAGIKRSEMEVTVLCGGSVKLDAGCLVAEDNGDSSERGGMKICELAGERAGERSLDVDSMDGTRRHLNELRK